MALLRVPARVVVLVLCASVPVGCAPGSPAPGARLPVPASAPVPAPVTAVDLSPASPASPASPSTADGTAAARRLAAAVAVVASREAGSASGVLTASGAGVTVVMETATTWRGGDWAERTVIEDLGGDRTAVDVLLVGDTGYLRVDAGPWLVLRGEDRPGAGPLAVRDPADALVALQEASRVEPGPAPDLLSATVPLQAVLGPDAGPGDVVVEIRLIVDRGVEVVDEVRLVTRGVPAVALHATWDPAAPPPVTAPQLAPEG